MCLGPGPGLIADKLFPFHLNFLLRPKLLQAEGPVLPALSDRPLQSVHSAGDGCFCWQLLQYKFGIAQGPSDLWAGHCIHRATEVF